VTVFRELLRIRHTAHYGEAQPTSAGESSLKSGLSSSRSRDALHSFNFDVRIRDGAGIVGGSSGEEIRDVLVAAHAK
jgi:hypothetical protein